MQSPGYTINCMHGAVPETMEIEILWLLLMFPVKFSAQTERLPEGSKGGSRCISPRNRSLNWKKDSAELLQDRRAATETGMEMSLRAWAQTPRTPERFSELWYNSYCRPVSCKDSSSYWNIIKKGKVWVIQHWNPILQGRNHVVMTLQEGSSHLSPRTCPRLLGKNVRELPVLSHASFDLTQPGSGGPGGSPGLQRVVTEKQPDVGEAPTGFLSSHAPFKQHWNLGFRKKRSSGALVVSSVVLNFC